MAEDRIKIVTKISSFLDCEKSFQNIETMVNDLTARINTKAESETIEEEGKTERWNCWWNACIIWS